MKHLGGGGATYIGYWSNIDIQPRQIGPLEIGSNIAHAWWRKVHGIYIYRIRCEQYEILSLKLVNNANQGASGM